MKTRGDKLLEKMGYKNKSLKKTGKEMDVMFKMGYNECLNEFEKIIDKLDKNLESSDGLNFRNKLLNKIKELKLKENK